MELEKAQRKSPWGEGARRDTAEQNGPCSTYNILICSTWLHQGAQEEGPQYSHRGVCYTPLTFPSKSDSSVVFGYKLPCPICPPREARWNKSTAAKIQGWATHVSTEGGGEGGTSCFSHEKARCQLVLPRFCPPANLLPPFFPSLVQKYFVFEVILPLNSSLDSINLPPASP